MKRHGNLFPRIITTENIYAAYRAARKGKGWQDTVKRFESNLEESINTIRDSLIDKTFTTSEYTKMRIYEPKERIIYKLPFNPDRIVQHALMNIIEPIWDPMFIYDSYACRKGKGIHAGSQRTMDFIRRVGADGYCLKMDISKFYPSINHDILYEIVKKKIKCRDTLWLLHNIIYSVDGDKNIPIGNYTSQWLGNLYLNELDQYLKHEHGVVNYIRYCDDFLILHEDKRYLHKMAQVIGEFINRELGMAFSKCDVFPIKRGIDFLGYRHFPRYVLLRKSTAKRIKHRLGALPDRLHRGDITRDQYRSSIASTMGWLKWANDHNFRNSIGIDRMWGELMNAE